MSRRTYVNNASNRSLGRVGMPVGSAVVSRSSGTSNSGASVSSSSYGSSSGSSRSGAYVDNSHNRSLGRVGKEYGTAVESKGISSGASGTGTTKTYVDNYQNRALGRVGQEHGTHVMSSSSGTSVASSSAKSVAKSSSSSSPKYVDNSYNRRLGRVGKIKGTHVVHKDESVSIDGKVTYRLTKGQERKRKIDDVFASYNESLVSRFDDLDIDPVPFSYAEADNIQAVVDKMGRLENIEENWRKREIPYQADISMIEGIVDHLIPYQDLEDLELISRGGFGVVHAALWKPRKIPIAYKRLACQNLTKKKIQSFKKEVEVFSKLDHKNIVKMFGAVMEENNFGIVMEYLKKTLFDALFNYEEDCLTPSNKHRIIEEVGSALEYLHTYTPPIAHCDIKSQNVLLSCNGTAKVCDFGLSVIRNTVQSSRSTSGHGDAPPGQGTPRYSAPEVLRGEILKLEDIMMADVYSFSLVVYETVMEEEPYEDLSPSQLTKNVGYGDLRPPVEELEKNPALVGFLTCGWSKVPRERPNIKRFNEDWKKIKI